MKLTAILAVPLALCFALGGAAIQAENEKHLGAENIRNNKLPVLHFVLMGLPVQSDEGYGQYGDGGWLIFTTSFDSPQARRGAPAEIHRPRLYAGASPGYAAQLPEPENLSTFGRGTFELNEIFEADEHEPNNALKQVVFAQGRWNRAYTHLATALFLAQMLLACMACAQAVHRRDTSAAPLFLTLLGAFLFLCIWETRARYFFQFMMVLLCAGAMFAPKRAGLNLLGGSIWLLIHTFSTVIPPVIDRLSTKPAESSDVFPESPNVSRALAMDNVRAFFFGRPSAHGLCTGFPQVFPHYPQRRPQVIHTHSGGL